MWQIIKAEYLHSFTSFDIKIIPYSILYIILFYSSNIKSELLIFYVFSAGMILTLHNDNRFYLFATLPITIQKIAFIRLQMLALNFSVLLIIIVPIILIQQNATENLIKLFVTAGIFVLMRLFSYSLFDIISGFSPRKKKLYLTLMLLFGVLMLLTYLYIITIYFHKPQIIEMLLTFLALSFFLILILSFVSIKTFLAKEKIIVREK